MYKLYYAAGVCSMAVHVVMEELGLTDFEIHQLDLLKGEHKTPEFLKINPRGQVAALETPDGVITENAAIIDYLNTKHGGALLGDSGYNRAMAMQWLLVVNTGIHGAYSKVLFALKNGGSDALIKAACDNVQAQWDEIEAQLERAGTSFLAGDNITAGDIYAAVVANWQFIPHLPTFGPKTQALIDAVSQRETFQRVLGKESVDYKVAA